jgi:hypothetical protein
MIERIRQFLRTGGGRIAAIVLAVLALVVVVYSVRENLGDSEAAALSKHRLYVCSETGKAFDVKIVSGLTNPVESPYSGKKTGYPAELCYWTKSGGVKKEPTGVLLNQTVGKRGPTFCPDCGRLVVPFNPPPMPGGKPPPTQAEYKPEQ